MVHVRTLVGVREWAGNAPALAETRATLEATPATSSEPAALVLLILIH